MNSKAKRPFRKDDEAVSPVIGVILMVAITVVLAAVVFVLVSNLGKGAEASENASVSVTSPSTGVIEVTLVRAGDHAPYKDSPSTDPSYYTVTINGVKCAVAELPNTWNAGEVVRLTSGASGGVCQAATVFAAGSSNVSVVVSAAKTTISSTTVNVKS